MTMCGCERHHDADAGCTCICPEHGNFELAQRLALSRYDEIVRLRDEVEAHFDGARRATNKISRIRQLALDPPGDCYGVPCIWPDDLTDVLDTDEEESS